MRTISAPLFLLLLTGVRPMPLKPVSAPQSIWSLLIVKDSGLSFPAGCIPWHYHARVSPPVSAPVSLYPNLAHDAYIYLNQFRSDPELYGSRIGLDLSQVRRSRTLQWDATLARAAEEKAYDMANENFFAHIDHHGHGMNYRVQELGYLLPPEWTARASANYIESIAANNKDPRHFIDQLIIDKDVPDKGHRLQLLAITNFYRNASRIGIGIAYQRNSSYKYYCCIVIAPKFESVPAE